MSEDPAEIVRCSACGLLKPDCRTAGTKLGHPVFVCRSCWEEKEEEMGRLGEFKRLCDEMENSGTSRSASELSRAAGALSNWVHTNSEAKTYYSEAIARMKARGTEEQGSEGVEEATPPDLATTIQLEEELHQLRQQLEQLEAYRVEVEALRLEVEQSDRELEKATAYCNHLEDELKRVEAQSTPTTDPQDWIVSQRQTWQAAVERLTIELVTAQKNLQAFKLLAQLYETDGVNPPPFVLNGHSLLENNGADDQVSGGNGNGRWGDHHQPEVVDVELSRSLSHGGATEGSGSLD